MILTVATLLALQATSPSDLPEGAVLRLGTSRLRPFNSSSSIVFFPDNRTVLVSDGVELALVDAKTRTLTRKLWKGLKTHGTPAVSPDGKLIAINDGNAGYLILDAASGNELQKLPAKGSTRSQFIAGGKWLAASDTRAVTIWDPRTGKSEKVLDLKGVSQFLIAPGEKVAAAFVYPSALLFWDPATGQELFREPTGTAIRSMAFSPDGSRLAVSFGSATQIWDVAGKTRLAEWKNSNDENWIAWSPLGTALACDHYQGIRLRDPATGKEIRQLGDRGKPAYSPDGKTLAIVDRYLSFHDPETGSDLHAGPGHVRPISALAYAPGGGRIVSAGEDHTLVVWDAKIGSVLRTISSAVSKFDRFDAVIDRMGFLPDGRTLWTLSRDGVFRAWDVDTGKPGLALQGAKGRFVGVASCPSGNTFATAGEGAIQIWDGATGAELKKFPKGAGGLGWTADGKTLITVSRMLTFLDPATGKELRSLQNLISGQHFRMASTGDRICGGHAPVRVWDMEMAHVPLHFDGMVIGDFLPGGNTFVGAGPRKFGLYDSATGETIKEREISPMIDAKIFAHSPEGKTLASSEMERSILIWELPKR